MGSCLPRRRTKSSSPKTEEARKLTTSSPAACLRFDIDSPPPSTPPPLVDFTQCEDAGPSDYEEEDHEDNGCEDDWDLGSQDDKENEFLELAEDRRNGTMSGCLSEGLECEERQEDNEHSDEGCDEMHDEEGYATHSDEEDGDRYTTDDCSHESDESDEEHDPESEFLTLAKARRNGTMSGCLAEGWEDRQTQEQRDDTLAMKLWAMARRRSARRLL
uniref:Uncharacterized protein n=1 Tax=Lotharella oceanica TaxID=641309 RepID=A0A7S2XGL0_9EUKA